MTTISWPRTNATESGLGAYGPESGRPITASSPKPGAAARGGATNGLGAALGVTVGGVLAVRTAVRTAVGEGETSLVVEHAHATRAITTTSAVRRIDPLCGGDMPVPPVQVGGSMKPGRRPRSSAARSVATAVHGS